MSLYIQKGPWQCINVTKTDPFMSKNKTNTLLLKPALISKYHVGLAHFLKKKDIIPFESCSFIKQSKLSPKANYEC